MHGPMRAHTGCLADSVTVACCIYRLQDTATQHTAVPSDYVQHALSTVWPALFKQHQSTATTTPSLCDSSHSQVPQQPTNLSTRC